MRYYYTNSFLMGTTMAASERIRQIIEQVNNGSYPGKHLDLNLKISSAEDLDAIANLLKENKTITIVDLSSNNIGDVGTGKLAEALKENKTITKVALRSNNIGVVFLQGIS